jgi:hypothetical protein
MERHELLDLMTSARTPNDISTAIAVGREWLVDHPADGDVRTAMQDLARQERERWGLSFA